MLISASASLPLLPLLLRVCCCRRRLLRAALFLRCWRQGGGASGHHQERRGQGEPPGYTCRCRVKHMLTVSQARLYAIATRHPRRFEGAQHAVLYAHRHF